MNIKELLEQLLYNLDEEVGQIFLEAVEEMGEEPDTDEILALYEELQSLDEEQIEELKAETLGSYIGKAVPERDNAKKEWWSTRGKSEENEKGKVADKKWSKRWKGVETAMDKLQRGQYQESEELSPETYKKFEAANQSGSKISETDSKHRKFNQDAKTEQEGSHLEGESLEGKDFKDKGTKLDNFAARLNAKARERVKDPQAIKEDAEQIDELKAETLGSYIGKAHKDLRKRAEKEKELDQLPKVVKLEGKLKDWYHSRQYTKSGDSIYRKQIDKAHKDISAEKKKADPEWPKSTSLGKRRSGIDAAAEKLRYGKFNESLDFIEDINAIFEGQEFSEEFKEKAAFILESSIRAKAKEAIEAYEDAILESVTELIEEEVDALKEEMEEQLDKYLDHIVGEYLVENELAIENGIKVELAESIMTGIKGVLVEHSITVPDEKVDLFEEAINEKEYVVESVIKEKEEAEALYQREVNLNIALKEEIDSLKRHLIIEEATKGLTDLERAKFEKIFEEVDFEDAEDFASKAELIVETYTKKKFVKPSTQLISEDFDEQEKYIEVAPEVEATLGALNKYSTK